MLQFGNLILFVKNIKNGYQITFTEQKKMIDI